jgi:aspartyl/asparaginyl beta-hydroxylase (cupin superfamily)
MDQSQLVVTFLFIIFVFLFSIFFMFRDYSNEEKIIPELLSKNYYTVIEICPDLNRIYRNLENIKKEINYIKKDHWPDWPEKKLYKNENFDTITTNSNPFKKSLQKNDFKWNIYPFMAFNVIVHENCKKCPTLWNFIKKIPGIKVALLSRLGPGTKLNTHRGWGNHSNHVIRCHFGFKVPKGCYVSVKENENDDEEIKLHEEDKWLIFDDSRYHYAHNPSNEERIVLIIDIERPTNIKTGTSDIGDTKELLQIVDYFKKKNINY